MSTYAIFITANPHEPMSVRPLPAEDTLKFFQDGVGGYVEVVPFHKFGVSGDVWCNEDGIAEGLPMNSAATVLVYGFSGEGVILGDVVLTSHVDRNGNTVGFTREQIRSMGYPDSVVQEAE